MALTMTLQCYHCFRLLHDFIITLTHASHFAQMLLHSSAKLDPPRIEKVKPEPRRYGCLMHSWSLCADQDWVMVRLEMELLLEPVDSTVSDEEKVGVSFNL